MLKQAAHIGLSLAAAQAGISLRRARIWQRRFQHEGEAGLADRSRPRRSPCRTDSGKRERIVALRRNHRLPYTEIARRVGATPATIGRICQDEQVAKLPPLQEAPPNFATSAPPRASCCIWTPRNWHVSTVPAIG